MPLTNVSRRAFRWPPPVECVVREVVKTVRGMTNTETPKFWTTTHASSACDTWATPRDLWARLDQEFHFGLDAAALRSSTLVPGNWYGPDHRRRARRDALACSWHADTSEAVWLNPPYARNVTGRFMAKALEESRAGLTVVCLVPVRTDTRWWHETVIDADAEVRWLRGRLKFGAATTPAPFPSALVIYRG